MNSKQTTITASHNRTLAQVFFALRPSRKVLSLSSIVPSFRKLLYEQRSPAPSRHPLFDHQIIICFSAEKQYLSSVKRQKFFPFYNRPPRPD